MNYDTFCSIRKEVEADDDDVIIVLRIKPKDVKKVTGALELVGITNQESRYVKGGE